MVSVDGMGAISIASDAFERVVASTHDEAWASWGAASAARR